MKLRAGGGVLALLALLIGVAGAGTAVPARAAGSSARCNYVVAGALERRIRGDASQPIGTSLDVLTARAQELDDVLQQAQIEDGILQSVCTPQTLPGPQDQLYGVMAWAYVLQADVAAKRFPLLHCPQTAATMPLGYVAGAWYALATTLVDPNRDETMPAPTPAPLVKEVIPKVQAQAQALGLVLPAPAEATEYWRDAQLAKTVPCTYPSP